MNIQPVFNNFWFTSSSGNFLRPERYEIYTLISHECKNQIQLLDGPDMGQVHPRVELGWVRMETRVRNIYRDGRISDPDTRIWPDFCRKAK